LPKAPPPPLPYRASIIDNEEAAPRPAASLSFSPKKDYYDCHKITGLLSKPRFEKAGYTEGCASL
jgi:hypothetical protein